MKKTKVLEPPDRSFKYIPKVFFKLTLVAVQYAFRYFILACTFLCEFRRVYAVSTKRFTGGLEYDHLQRDLGNLSKLPRHMSFVINEDVATDYCDVANLIVWTIALGIPYITLYDRHGLLKAGEFRLGKVVKDKIASLIGPEKSEGIDIILKNSSTRYENGVTYPKRVCVQLLSEDDGKGDILESARRIASDYSQKNLDIKQINIDYVDQSLKATGNIPDPELALLFGSTNSLMGFLPWQTRLTEIMRVPTMRNIHYSTFTELLQKYSKCNQRFGK